MITGIAFSRKSKAFFNTSKLKSCHKLCGCKIFEEMQKKPQKSLQDSKGTKTITQVDNDDISIYTDITTSTEAYLMRDTLHRIE